MTTETTTLNKVEAVKTLLEKSASLGRKFDRIDSFSYDHWKCAMAYASKYDGDFAFMIKMREWVRAGAMLTNAQTASVLNCLVSEMKRRLANKAVPVVPASTNDIHTGFYTVQLDDSLHLTLRIEDASKEWNTNAYVVGVLTGTDNTSDYTNFAFLYKSGRIQMWKKFSTGYDNWKDALQFLVLGDVSERAKMGKMFAVQSGRCWRCGRLLTTLDSVADGIGPVCKKALT